MEGFCIAGEVLIFKVTQAGYVYTESMFTILIILTFAVSYGVQWAIRFATPGSSLESGLLKAQLPLTGTLLAASLMLAWPSIQKTPPLLLFLSSPLIIFVILLIMLAMARRAQYRRTGRSWRSRQKEDQQRGLARATAGYWPRFFWWLRLALSGDTPKWSPIHQGLLLGALLAAANLSWVGVLVGALLVSVSIARAFSLRAKQQEHLARLGEFLLEKKVIKKDMNPAKAVKIDWDLDQHTPRQIRIGYHVGYSVHEERTRNDFEKSFDGQFWTDDAYKIVWDQRNNQIVISTIVLPANIRWSGRVHEDPYTFVIGTNLATGEDVTFSVKSENPHALACGGTGSGKSEVMMTYIGQAMLKGWYVALADPKTSGLVQFTRKRRYSNRNGINTGVAPLMVGDARPGIIAHATDIVGCGDVLQMALAETEHRKQLTALYNVSNVGSLPADVRAGTGGTAPIKPMLVVVDEVVSLFMIEKVDTDDPVMLNQMEARKAAKVALLRLAMEARAFEIFLLVAGQQPSASDLGSNFRAQLGLRVAMGGLNSGTSLMAFNEANPVELKTLNKRTGKKVPGRGRFKPDMSLPTETMQAWWCGPEAADLDEFCPYPDYPEVETPVQMPETFLVGTPWEKKTSHPEPPEQVPAPAPEASSKSKPARALEIIDSDEPMASVSEPTDWAGAVESHTETEEEPTGGSVDDDAEAWMQYQQELFDTPGESSSEMADFQPPNPRNNSSEDWV